MERGGISTAFNAQSTPVPGLQTMQTTVSPQRVILAQFAPLH
jgi:hypothetical protein